MQPLSLKSQSIEERLHNKSLNKRFFSLLHGILS